MLNFDPTPDPLRVRSSTGKGSLRSVDSNIATDSSANDTSSAALPDVAAFLPIGVVPRSVTDIHSTRVLSLDSSGRILDWISWQDTVCLYVRDAVSWTLGEPCLTIHGGMSRLNGAQSQLQLHPIVASRGHARMRNTDPAPALTNAALFARDRMLCLYCGEHFHRGELTRDHVVPLSKGGGDHWENVVTACLSCNIYKGSKTPQQAGMPLLAVPYRPSWVEHLILSNRNILVDQMEFLLNHMPKSRRRA